jgi:alpha,alpha-trehalase
MWGNHFPNTLAFFFWKNHKRKYGMPFQSLISIPPDQLYGALFHDVQMAHVFPDCKTFADCYPRETPEEIVGRYEVEKHRDGFNLSAFVRDHFFLPPMPGTGFTSDPTRPTAEHIRSMWPLLTRRAEPNSTLLPVPHAYVVPGGRFRGLFYWDSYFTMLGLAQSGQSDLVRCMVDNFAHLLDAHGHIPNANRTYFLSRSQPPFFAHMVRLLAETDGPAALSRYLPQLQKEYGFWMEGAFRLDEADPRHRRVVRLPDGTVLNRYWDDLPSPRPEAYRQDVEMAHDARQWHGTPPSRFYRDVRAACESGWDFSSRWFANPTDMTTIRTTDILPVDLNCLLYFLEKTLAEAHHAAGHADVAERFAEAAERRRNFIQCCFWDENAGFFFDFDAEKNERSPALTLAGLFPLYVGMATPEQAARVHERIRDEFLQVGGLVTTPVRSGQQWDAPIGWAPLQWVGYESLRAYGFAETAAEIRRRWLHLNDRVFRNTGKMTEKYNVMDQDVEATGGEYPNQDGFGWTNGVYLKLKATLSEEDSAVEATILGENS